MEPDELRKLLDEHSEKEAKKKQEEKESKLKTWLSAVSVFFKRNKKKIRMTSSTERSLLRPVRGIVMFLIISALIFAAYYVALWTMSYFLSFIVDTENIFFWGKIMGIFLAPFGAALVIWYKLAPKNRWYSLGYEATAKAVVRAGADPIIIMRYKDHYLDDEGYVKEIKKEKGEKPKKPGFFRSFFGGIFCYSLIHPIADIYVYDFTWSGVKQNGQPEHHPKEKLDYITLKQDSYYTSLDDVEDQEGITLSVGFIFNIRVVNPGKALFAPENWLEMVLINSLTVCREVISFKGYFEWLKTHQAEAGQEIYKRLSDEKFLENFVSNLGIEVLSVRILSIKPPDSIAKASEKPKVALKEGEAAVISAEKQRDAMIARAEGEATAYEKKYSAIEKNKERLYIRMLEAMEKSPQEGAKWILSAYPQTAQLFSETARKIPEKISEEEIPKWLPILVEELRNGIADALKTNKSDKNKKTSKEKDENKEEDVDEDEEEQA
jgi:hypothetical protein